MYWYDQSNLMGYIIIKLRMKVKVVRLKCYLRVQAKIKSRKDSRTFLERLRWRLRNNVLPFLYLSAFYN